MNIVHEKQPTQPVEPVEVTPAPEQVYQTTATPEPQQADPKVHEHVDEENQAFIRVEEVPASSVPDLEPIVQIAAPEPIVQQQEIPSQLQPEPVVVEVAPEVVAVPEPVIEVVPEPIVAIQEPVQEIEQVHAAPEPSIVQVRTFYFIQFM